MLNEGKNKSHVTKRYAGTEQNEKCAKSVNDRTRKREQRKRDRLLGADLRKQFAEHASIAKANLFIGTVLSKYAVGLDWEDKPLVSVCGWGDDPRDWEISIITPEDRKIQDMAERPIPWQIRFAPLPEREEYLRRMLSEMKDLRTRSEATKRSLGVEHRVKIRDLLKDNAT